MRAGETKEQFRNWNITICGSDISNDMWNFKSHLKSKKEN